MQPDLIALLILSIVVLGVFIARPALTRQPAGKALAFLGIFLLPAMTLYSGFETHMEKSKTREFCLTCHVMQDYGKSLMVDDAEYIPAVHYQNNYVPRDKACFTCHTDYALYGDLRAKMRGLRHLMVQYSGSVPDTIHLYSPFNNRECLHCHGESRKFLTNSAHTEEDTTMVAMKAGRLSCLASGCHDVAHDVHNLADAPVWKEPRR